MDWPMAYVGLAAAGALWLVLPIISSAHMPRQPRWLRWLARLSRMGQLVGLGVVAGSCAGVGAALVQLLQGSAFSSEPIQFASGWLAGSVLIGGWQAKRGRLRLPKRD